MLLVATPRARLPRGQVPGRDSPPHGSYAHQRLRCRISQRPSSEGFGDSVAVRLDGNSCIERGSAFPRRAGPTLDYRHGTASRHNVGTYYMRKITVLLVAAAAIAAPNTVAGSASAADSTNGNPTAATRDATANSGVRPGASATVAKVPVLGAKGFSAGHGYGWGTAHPRSISNGGDPSGFVYRIAWRHWGANRAIGYGKTPILKPTGGYYSSLGRITLRAQRLGRCGGHRAYTRMYFRGVRKPGGPLGRWQGWSWMGGNICRSPWA